MARIVMACANGGDEVVCLFLGFDMDQLGDKAAFTINKLTGCLDVRTQREIALHKRLPKLHNLGAMHLGDAHGTRNLLGIGIGDARAREDDQTARSVLGKLLQTGDVVIDVGAGRTAMVRMRSTPCSEKPIDCIELKLGGHIVKGNGR